MYISQVNYELVEISNDSISEMHVNHLMDLSISEIIKPAKCHHRQHCYTLMEVENEICVRY